MQEDEPLWHPGQPHSWWEALEHQWLRKLLPLMHHQQAKYLASIQGISIQSFRKRALQNWTENTILLVQ
jgi:hypothetical protein